MSTDRSVRRTEESVDAFLATDDVDETMRLLDRRITAALPTADRSLWRGVFWGGTEQSIIGYGRIEQPRPRSEPVQWFLVGLARQKRHVSLYVNAAEGGQYLSTSYGPRLGKTRVGAASIAFSSADVLDLVVLDELLAHAARLVPFA